MLAASFGANVYFAHDVIVQRITRQSRVRAEGPDALEETSNLGRRVASLTVNSVDGVASTLAIPSEKATVLYIFSPKCRWCAANLASINELAKQKGDSYRFIGVSVHPDSEVFKRYSETHALSFPSYQDALESDLDSLAYHGTPQTIVFTKNGVIEHNWSGAYVNSTGAKVQSFFKARLPKIPVS